MKIHLVFLVLAVILAVAFSQDSSEESPVPKKTLKRYRIRRPIVQIDEEGNPKPTATSQRVRRIRIKARPTESTVEESPARGEQTVIVQQPQLLPTQQAFTQRQYQQVIYEEPQVVEPVRNVPQYRTATPSGTRSQLLANVNLREQRTRGGDDDRKSVGTTRNYSHLNEDGSFTFGYEAEDGSFKEETRGIDCVVRGKYGYVDPDGVRREFSYVSGNPCDPNNPEGNDDTLVSDDDEKAAPPARPLLRRVRPEISQNVLQGLEQTAEEKLPEDQLQALFRVQPRQRRPTAAPSVQPTTFRPRIRVSTAAPTPTAAALTGDEPAVLQPFVYQQRPRQQIRPVYAEVDNALPRGRSLFNFQNEVQRITQNQIQASPVAPAAEPQLQYSPQYYTHTFPARQVFGNPSAPTPVATPTAATVAPTIASRGRPLVRTKAPSSDEEIKVNRPAAQIASSEEAQQQPNFGNYHTELVYDPASNQYTSVLVQDIPKTNDEITLTQRLRAFVDPQRPNQFQVQQFGQPQVQYFGNAQHLFQGQQRQQQAQQAFQGPPQAFNPGPFLPQGALPVRGLQQQQQIPTPTPPIPQLHAEAQQLQSLAPHSSPATGQIDAFLRSLNISV